MLVIRILAKGVITVFVAREKELDLLDKAYAEGGFHMAVVYGRRRVGKTSLLRAFIASKPNACYFTAQDTLAQENLDGLSRSILAPGDAEMVDYSAVPSFGSFKDALQSVFDRAEKERMVLVIDEYPYLAQSYPGASSLIQALIDERKNRSKLFFVLCGSSMSFMEHQVLGHKSPLYGRRTLQLKVEPFDAFDARKVLGEVDAMRAIELYSLVGGVPLYLEQIDGTKGVAWNIANRILKTGAFLDVEPENYLMQEVRSPAAYNAIISAIAAGYVRSSEISDATHLQSSAVTRYLDALRELQIVEKTMPVIDANRKRVVYRITDNLFRFWYSFAPRYASAIDAGMSDAVAKRIVENNFSTYVGSVFETVCRQWLKRRFYAGDIDMLPKEIGTWWGTDPRRKEQVEIDIVVTGADGELLLGECKWRNEPIDVDVLNLLVERGELLSAKRKLFYLFSKTGFTQACKTKASSMGNVNLVTAEMMFR